MSSTTENTQAAGTAGNGVKQESSVYPFPHKSSAETERLNRQHRVFKVRWNGNYQTDFQRLPPPKRILDLGCGTGMWCAEVAADFPSAEIIGVDISPPAESSFDSGMPSNCRFYPANIEEPWTFPGSETPFDFICIRMLVAAVRDWPELLRRCYEHLRPSGYLEVFEGVFEICAGADNGPEPSAAIQWSNHVKHFMTSVGMRWDMSLRIPQMLRETGFEIISDRVRKMQLWPDEADPKDLRESTSTQYAMDLAEMVQNMRARIFNYEASPLSQEEGDNLTSRAENEFLHEGAKQQLHTHLYIRVARKPVSESN